MSLGAETVIRHRGGGTDDMGNPVASSDPVTFTGCAVYPRGISTEETGRANSVLEGYTVLIPPQNGAPADVLPTDELEWARRPGKRAQAIGDIGLWSFLDGDLAGVQVNVRYEAG